MRRIRSCSLNWGVAAGALFALVLGLSVPAETSLARSSGAFQDAPAGDSGANKGDKIPIPKCALVGTWRNSITIPDGADGVAATVVLRISQSGSTVTLKGWANDKPLEIEKATATCEGFSFVLPQGKVPVTFSGKISDDKRALSGTAKRQDVSTTWSLQRQS